MQNRKRVYQKAGKFAGLFFALLCLFSCIPSAAETSGTYKIWSIPDSVSLCQQEKTTAILADGVQLTACEGTLYWNRGTAAYSCYGGGIPDRLDDYGICYWDSSSYSSFDSCSYTHTKKRKRRQVFKV